MILLAEPTNIELLKLLGGLGAGGLIAWLVLAGVVDPARYGAQKDRDIAALWAACEAERRRADAAVEQLKRALDRLDAADRKG